MKIKKLKKVSCVIPCKFNFFRILNLIQQRLRRYMLIFSLTHYICTHTIYKNVLSFIIIIIWNIAGVVFWDKKVPERSARKIDCKIPCKR